MFHNKNFYPTSDWLIDKMLDKVNMYKVSRILEPSAGKANILDRIKERGKADRYSRVKSLFAIELDPNLQAIIRSKGYNIIFNDFLQLETYQKFHLIIMNPPFDNGDKHLLKAIELQERYGGQIVCLLNAETIKNDFSNTRKDLLDKLDKYNADIEFIENAFTDSERKTDVETALIYLEIEPQRKNSIIIENLKQEENYKTKQSNFNKVVSGDYIERAIAQYDFEVKAGVNLINEYESMLPYISREFDKETPILKLCMNDSNKYNDSTGGLVNEYLKTIRYKYWCVLFNSKEFCKLFTTDLRSKYMEKLDELKEYDFSRYNIEQIKLDMQLMLMDSLEDTIMALFQEFTYQHSYNREYDNNIHYYNGWMNNKAEKINDKKIIIPLAGFDNYDSSFYPTRYHVREKLMDIEKVFNYLDNGRTQFDTSIDEVLKQAQSEGQTKRIEFRYFFGTFYKKGTFHIEWKDKALIQKFNVYAAINMQNLPPSYGKKNYSTMDQAEKDVIDSFQGKEEYSKVMQDKGFYLSGSDSLLMIGGDVA